MRCRTGSWSCPMTAFVGVVHSDNVVFVSLLVSHTELEYSGTRSGLRFSGT
jgi:hypothetical protein